MRPLALEAQVLRDLPADETVIAAARAGFQMSGVWIDPASWTSTKTLAVRRAFADTGLLPLDAEVIRIQDRVDADQLKLLEIAGEIGIPHVIAISLDSDINRAAAILSTLAERAKDAGTAISLEFAPFTSVPTVEAALDIVAASGKPVGILADPLHLERSGGRPGDLAKIPPGWIRFAQICDAGSAPDRLTPETLLWEARHDRREVGQGTLPLAEYVAALPPEVPLSDETRSLALERRYPDPYERASTLADRMRAFLRTLEAGEQASGD